MNTKLVQLYHQSTIDFLLNSAQELGSFKAMPKSDSDFLQERLATISGTTPSSIGLLVTAGLKKIHANYSSYVDSYKSHHDKKYYKDLEKTVQKHNARLVEFLKDISAQHNYSIKEASKTAFFSSVIDANILFFDQNSSVCSSMLESVIDIFTSSPIEHKTEFMTKFLNSKIGYTYRSFMSEYFFENIETARFKKNFAFSQKTLTDMFLLKADLSGGLIETQRYTKDTLSKDLALAQQFKLDMSQVFPKYISFITKNVGNVTPSLIINTDLEDIGLMLCDIAKNLSDNCAMIHQLHDFGTKHNCPLSSKECTTLFSYAGKYVVALHLATSNLTQYFFNIESLSSNAGFNPAALGQALKDIDGALQDFSRLHSSLGVNLSLTKDLALKKYFEEINQYQSCTYDAQEGFKSMLSTIRSTINLEFKTLKKNLLPVIDSYTEKKSLGAFIKAKKTTTADTFKL